MQIDFTPEKIRASKKYLTQLLKEEQRAIKISNPPFWRRIFKFLFGRRGS
jgi:hypothetical protein